MKRSIIEISVIAIMATMLVAQPASARPKGDNGMTLLAQSANPNPDRPKRNDGPANPNPERPKRNDGPANPSPERPKRNDGPASPIQWLVNLMFG